MLKFEHVTNLNLVRIMHLRSALFFFRQLRVCTNWDRVYKQFPYLKVLLLLLLFAMIRYVVKSFKVSDVEVAAARMSNESALTRMTDSTPKNLGQT